MGLVYVFKGVDTNLFKIGRTASKKTLENRRSYARQQINHQRLQEIHQRSEPVEVYLWACIGTDNPPGLEYQLHTMLDKHWAGAFSEWFNLPLLEAMALRSSSNCAVQNDLLEWLPCDKDQVDSKWAASEVVA